MEHQIGNVPVIVLDDEMNIKDESDSYLSHKTENTPISFNTNGITKEKPYILKPEMPEGQNGGDQNLVRKPIKQLRRLHGGPKYDQNIWIKRLRDDQNFKGVYFSRDGVPYSKVNY